MMISRLNSESEIVEERRQRNGRINMTFSRKAHSRAITVTSAIYVQYRNPRISCGFYIARSAPIFERREIDGILIPI